MRPRTLVAYDRTSHVLDPSSRSCNQRWCSFRARVGQELAKVSAASGAETSERSLAGVGRRAGAGPGDNVDTSKAEGGRVAPAPSRSRLRRGGAKEGTSGGASGRLPPVAGTPGKSRLGALGAETKEDGAEAALGVPDAARAAARRRSRRQSAMVPDGRAAALRSAAAAAASQRDVCSRGCDEAAAEAGAVAPHSVG